MSLGFDQNNPTNLTKGTAWEGLIPSENRFAAFSDMPYGIRAWLMNLHSKVIKGQNTYHDYIYVFAPPEDGNDTAVYLDNILAAGGWSANDHIDLSDVALQTLLRAQIKQEIGDDTNNVTDEDIKAGFDRFKTSVTGFVTDAVSTISVKTGKAFLPIVISFFVLILISIYFLFRKKR